VWTILDEQCSVYEGGRYMNNWWYSFYLAIVGIVSIFTGEIVTFIMLGIILISLNNINTTLKKIYNQNKSKVHHVESELNE